MKQTQLLPNETMLRVVRVSKTNPNDTLTKQMTVSEWYSFKRQKKYFYYAHQI